MLACFVLMRSASTDATLTGFFVDELGGMIGTSSYTGTISSTPLTLMTLFSLTAIPSGAVGFVGRLTTADIIYSTGGDGTATVPTAISTDMSSNTSRYPVLTQSTSFALGRVG